MHRPDKAASLHVRWMLISASFVLFLALGGQACAASLPDGSLVRTDDDPKVYYLQNGTKRWVNSEEAFLAQGFRWSDITMVDRARLDALPEGAPITVTEQARLEAERAMLPDLAPVAPYDLRYSVEDGQTRLRFTATFWNRGKGALELNADTGENATQGDAEYHASQRLFREDGTFLDVDVGTLFWHDIHTHYHYDEFGEYVLERVDGTGETKTLKTTFCMRDDMSIGAPSDGPKQSRAYNGCGGHRQGVSVGWADVYPHTLPDQYFDVSSLPAGLYAMKFRVDPMDHFAESRRDNNESVTLVELDPARRSFRVVAVGSPYESPSNRFPDGTLIKAKSDARVYVTIGNKKRWIPNERAFLANGYSWGLIRTLPEGVINAIPDHELVRAGGTSAVYVLNDAGYKRRILNPEVMSSYGWGAGDVIVVTQADVDGYPDTDLVRKNASVNAYSLSSRRLVASTDALQGMGLDPRSVHVLNQTDWNAYAVATVAQNLSIPWDIAFLPDGDFLVTERTGTLRRIGSRPATISVPNVYTSGEGGLMGIALAPDFAESNFVYLYYTTDAGGRKNRVVRFRLEGDRLVQDRVILDNIPSAIYHDGGQIDFGPDGKLYIATGDATDPNAAQDTQSLAGKILRLNADGSMPGDNPFGNAVWSYGHRNPQGLVWDENGTLYVSEHGPTGEFGLCCRDELNRIEKGGNYGWPIISGDQRRDGMISPLITSGGTVTWAPSGLAYVNGKLLFSGLRSSTLYEAVLENGAVSRLNGYFGGRYGRIRAAVAAPDGSLYISTSNRDGRGTARAGDDKILRIFPDFLQ